MDLPAGSLERRGGEAEFAAITETLLIDADGVYDPGDVHDRMLLGMKSILDEVELHVMAQRLQASKKAAAARGQLRTPLPVGYVHDEAGEVVIDPDAEVQAAIGDLFAAFAACGSAYGVVGYRYRGYTSPNSWNKLKSHLTADTVQSQLPRDRHGGFGERPGETDREQPRQRAPGRLNHRTG